MKSKNYIYITIIVLFLLVTVVFFSSRLWLLDDRAKKTENYDEIKTAGTYSFRISNAVLDTSTNTLTLDLYYMSMEPDKDPVTFLVYTDGNKNKELAWTTTEKDSTNLTISIPQIPDGFYYVTVEARTLDKERKPVSLITSIDYRSIRDIDTSNIVYVYATPTEIPTPTQIPAYPKDTIESIVPHEATVS
ncbi:MAG: hypothetical protein WCG21_14525 [Eubacteriales bacterium]